MWTRSFTHIVNVDQVLYLNSQCRPGPLPLVNVDQVIYLCSQCGPGQWPAGSTPWRRVACVVWHTRSLWHLASYWLLSPAVSTQHRQGTYISARQAILYIIFSSELHNTMRAYANSDRCTRLTLIIDIYLICLFRIHKWVITRLGTIALCIVPALVIIVLGVVSQAFV